MDTPNKKIQIFEAVFTLATQGKDLNLLTVQEIATQAEIGKGTLYEYFKSKDEIVHESVLYYAQKEFKVLYKIIKEPISFEDKLKKIMKQMMENQSQNTSFKVIVAQMQHLKLTSSMIDLDDKKKEALSYVVDYLDNLIELGIHENKIRKDYTREYLRYCLFGAFSTITFATVGKGILNQNHDVETAIDYGLQMIQSTILI